MTRPNRTERNTIDASGKGTLTVKTLAFKAGNEVSGYFKRPLISLCKRGILCNNRPGYLLNPKYHYLMDETACDRIYDVMRCFSLLSGFRQKPIGIL